MRWWMVVMMAGMVATAFGGWEPLARKELAVLPGGARLVECEARDGSRGAIVQGVFFRERQGRFAVIDNVRGISLGEAMHEVGALAGTNGAYFHADATPVGLMIAQGRKVHGFERAKLLSGVFVVTKGRSRIVRAAKFTASAGDSDALQAGPFLVENGQPIVGLNAARAARRTVVATDGKGGWALLSFSPVTLAEAAAILATSAIGSDCRVERALNLDGGSSTGLWAETSPAFYRAEFTTVRNFVAILPP